MPEGDTLARTAQRLRPALEGQTLVTLAVRGNRHPLPPAGSVVDTVEARGKHLLVRFSDGSVLHSHLGMTGIWHLYRRGERWRDEPGAARARVVVPAHEAVLFRAPTVSLWPARLPGTRPWEQLGPDLCRPPVDLDAIVANVAGLPARTEVAEVLLDQRVAAGIGNVYKSETLFACGVNPFEPVGALEPAALRRLFATASALLASNLGACRRRTHGSGLAVYGRGGRDCPRCHATIRTIRQGDRGRVTYWCPRCQPARPAQPARPHASQRAGSHPELLAPHEP